MREISLAVLDIAQNSIDANAGLIKIDLSVNDDFIEIKVSDDGEGMSDTQIERVTELGISYKGSSGLGLALLKDEILQCDGVLNIKSEVGFGTDVEARYNRIAQAVIGDLGSTFVTLVDESFDTVLTLNIRGLVAEYDTRKIKSSACVADLQSSGALRLIREDINKKINGGAML